MAHLISIDAFGTHKILWDRWKAGREPPSKVAQGIDDEPEGESLYNEDVEDPGEEVETASMMGTVGNSKFEDSVAWLTQGTTLDDLSCHVDSFFDLEEDVRLTNSIVPC